MPSPMDNNMHDPRRYEGTEPPPSADREGKCLGCGNETPAPELAWCPGCAQILKLPEDQTVEQVVAAINLPPNHEALEHLIVVDSLSGVNKTGDYVPPSAFGKPREGYGPGFKPGSKPGEHNTVIGYGSPNGPVTGSHGGCMGATSGESVTPPANNSNFIDSMHALGECVIQNIKKTMPDVPPERRHLHGVWGNRMVSTMRVRGIWTLQVGLSPTMLQAELAEQWFYLREDHEFDLTVHPEMPTRFSELDTAAHARARELTDPARMNYLKLEFLWL